MTLDAFSRLGATSMQASTTRIPSVRYARAAGSTRAIDVFAERRFEAVQTGCRHDSNPLRVSLPGAVDPVIEAVGKAATHGLLFLVSR